MNETTPVVNRVPVVGDIFQMSWGYDQTNVDYFQVTRLSAAGVFVREIAAKGVLGTDGFMCQQVLPVKDAFTTDRSVQWCGKRHENGGLDNSETFRKIKYYQGRPGFSIKGRYFARLWDGKSTYSSWYA
jgi:hypothetical protein